MASRRGMKTATLSKVGRWRIVKTDLKTVLQIEGTIAQLFARDRGELEVFVYVRCVQCTGALLISTIPFG